jgi:undecaprenyl diphosphate synthase
MHNLSPPAVPRHIAIIMDGNGRWAANRGLPRSSGHKQGIEALRRTVKAAGDIGVEFLTVYAFSTENWSRPKAEVSILMDLFRRFVRQDVAELHASNICIRMIGDRDGLDRTTLSLIDEAEKLTANNDGMTLIIAFNYGARQELLRAIRTLAEDVKEGRLRAEMIDVGSVSLKLDTHDWPDPDLLIRTGGEMRISNFLLWQSAYTEFVFVADHWPDFDATTLNRAIAEFHSRDRRYGGLKVQTA